MNAVEPGGFAEGDRVVFRAERGRDDRKNGYRATVKIVGRRGYAIEFDDGTGYGVCPSEIKPAPLNEKK